MATIKRKSTDHSQFNVRKKIFVDMPQEDIPFFRLFAGKMGWMVNDSEASWENYIKTSPKDIPLTDDDIMAAVREVRYGKA